MFSTNTKQPHRNQGPQSSPFPLKINTAKMVSLESNQGEYTAIETTSSPRISFSADFLNEKNYISIRPGSEIKNDNEVQQEKTWNAGFEFLSSNVSSIRMLPADELFSEGKLLPFWQIQQCEKLNRISLKTKYAENAEGEVALKKDEGMMSWFVDDDPSPKPPKCTVLWKELLRLRKHKTSSLSPSSSSSSSSASSLSSLSDIAATENKKNVKKIRKGMERTRSNSIKLRPMINVPICTPVKSNTLPPLFPQGKGRLER